MDSKPEEECLLEKSPPSRKGGFRTMPFIIVASFVPTPNMIIYLMNDHHLDAATGSSIIYLWLALSNFLSIFGAVSANFTCWFSVISLGSISSLLGMRSFIANCGISSQLKPSFCDQSSNSCNSAAAQLAVLFLSFSGCCVRALFYCFRGRSVANVLLLLIKRGWLDASIFNWYYASAMFSNIVAVTVIVYIQDRYGWKIGFAVPFILMSISVLIFLLGSSLYVKVKVRESLFAGFFQVLVAAFQKRNVCHKLINSDPSYYYKDKSSLLAPSNDWRFLNNVCIIIEDPDSDANPDGSGSNCGVSVMWNW
ncbi:hypothetical protein Leryth_025343 [Lithospermum erythrorhizon]|nr:hypothetical protein Leryth_025343 [Lithospermum erythrorhizon]